MDYQEALGFLRELTKFGFNFGLERILRLLQLLDNPHKSIKTVHVAGTNGKGSVCAYVSNVLSCAGYKTGLFTSPHLHSYTERIKINGINISQQEVAEYLTCIKPLLAQMLEEGCEHPTEFEVNTALALKYFADQKVDIAVIEVGLGGAIDSTNVITPLVTAITNVSLDHLDYLGDTVAEIANVKSGIIKCGIPCVTAAQGEVLEVIIERCKLQKAPLILLGKDIIIKEYKEMPSGAEITFSYKNLTAQTTVHTKLLGEHQKYNAGVALGIINCLIENSFDISGQAISQGFAETNWPARLEIISDKPLIIVDAAHNHAGAQALAQTLQQLRLQKVVLVLGILADKERKKIISELIPFAEYVIVTKPNTPRAGDWQEVYRAINEQDISAQAIESISEAVEKAKSYQLPVVITGSIYMVSQARAHLLGIIQE